MSRIAEALTQSLPAGDHDPAPEAAVVRPAGTAVLEDYPVEGRIGVAPPRTHDEERPRVFSPSPAVERSEPWHVPAALEGRVVVSRGVPAVCLEQYRRLAAALHDIQIERGLKVLMVTSALPQDGKTLTAVNLAFTLSESYGRRVLLIDADLRRPSLHRLLGLPNGAGLSEVLRAEIRDLPAVRVSERLSVMPAGRPDASPLASLTSDRMRDVLDQCTSQYEWVLLDAPPVALLPDAQLLGRLTRAVIFVIGAGSTPYPVIERTIEELGPESIVGCVLNRVSEDSIPAATYYRGYYHSTKSQR